MKEKDRELALYRKYRPQTFKEVLGQEHITKVLEGSIKLGKTSHAYLFAGSRGTGKTSVARIFAREVGTSSNDMIEIDAASNTGVDDIRSLNESVSVSPFESKYKVYIVDEVHMLSKSAFNALLKTLEEPPEHVIFILATTEAEKLPETVVSRCQVFNFRRPSQHTLMEWVAEVAKKENFVLEQSSADLIALLGDGSFRDAVGILQKVISASPDKKISVKEVEGVTGAPKSEIINSFITALENKNAEQALSFARRSSDGNIDVKVFLKLVLRKVRFILLLKHAPRLKEEIRKELSEEDYKFLGGISGKKDLNIDSSFLLTLLEAYDRINYSFIPEISIELAVVKICGDK